MTAACTAGSAAVRKEIMSKDKYPSIFSPQMEAIVFIIVQFFFATRALLKMGNILGYSPVFGHVTRVDQSRASEKI